jgi:NADH-quinone oxidoreductase subunit J
MTHNELPLFYVFNFYLFGLIAMISAVAFVTRKSPVAAAIWLVNTMFCLAALYVMLDAQFIGTMQVLVYAGAIMVVFLFVIMLLNLGHPSELADARGLWWKLLAGAVGLALLAQVFAVTRAHLPEALTLPEGTIAGQVAKDGAIAPFAGVLFRDYLLAFEVTSVLLLAAVVGAVVLGKRKERAHAR